jgi:hypothetical protein
MVLGEPWPFLNDDPLPTSGPRRGHGELLALVEHQRGVRLDARDISESGNTRRYRWQNCRFRPSGKPQVIPAFKVVILCSQMLTMPVTPRYGHRGVLVPKPVGELVGN